MSKPWVFRVGFVSARRQEEEEETNKLVVWMHMMIIVIVVADTRENASRSPPMRNHRESRVRCTCYPRCHLSDDAVQLTEIQSVQCQGRSTIVHLAGEEEWMKDDLYLIIACRLVLFAMFRCWFQFATWKREREVTFSGGPKNRNHVEEQPEVSS